MYSGKGLHLENKKYVVSIFIWAGLSLSYYPSSAIIFILEYLSTVGQTAAV